MSIIVCYIKPTNNCVKDFCHKYIITTATNCSGSVFGSYVVDFIGKRSTSFSDSMNKMSLVFESNEYRDSFIRTLRTDGLCELNNDVITFNFAYTDSITIQVELCIARDMSFDMNSISMTYCQSKDVIKLRDEIMSCANLVKRANAYYLKLGVINETQKNGLSCTWDGSIGTVTFPRGNIRECTLAILDAICIEFELNLTYVGNTATASVEGCTILFVVNKDE